MKNMFERPTVIWLLPSGTEERARQLTSEEMDSLLERYEETGWEPKFTELRKLVKCDYLELVPLTVGHLWADENGMLLGKEPNFYATYLRLADGAPGDIVGNTVLVVYPDQNPDIVDEWAVEMKRLIEQVSKMRGTGGG